MKVINLSHDASNLSLEKNDKDETWLEIAGDKNNHEIKIEAYPEHNFFQAQDKLSFVATSVGKVEKSKDEFLIIDVRLTAEHLETVPYSENIRNLLQIAISNENTVPLTEIFDQIMPTASLRGRSYMSYEGCKVEHIEENFNNPIRAKTQIEKFHGEEWDKVKK